MRSRSRLRGVAVARLGVGAALLVAACAAPTASRPARPGVGFGQPIGAPILFDYIRRAMPMDRPQTLTADEVYAVSAYLLHVNGLIPADAVMDAHSLPNVSMPNRDGFIPDDRPDTRAVRCMRDCK